MPQIQAIGNKNIRGIISAALGDLDQGYLDKYR